MGLKTLDKTNIFTDKADAERRSLNSIQYWNLKDVSEQLGNKDEDLNFILNETRIIQDTINVDIKHSNYNVEYLTEVASNLISELEEKFFKRIQDRIKENNEKIGVLLNKELKESENEDSTAELLKMKRLENQYQGLLSSEIKELAKSYVTKSENPDDLVFQLQKKDEMNVVIRELKARKEDQLAISVRQAMLKVNADYPFLNRTDVKEIQSENNFLKQISVGSWKDRSGNFFEAKIKDLVKVDMGIKDFKGRVR